ncbi:MAG: hypothetical protein J7K72_00945 [Candidatus Aenigmarchaeota archaeon]|nr:hypothetical protein [Candidatus Aenigmarchaeota archaeon]
MNNFPVGKKLEKSPGQVITTSNKIIKNRNDCEHETKILKKRSFIQYDTPEIIKISKVKTSLKRAKEFMLHIGKLIEE